MFNVQDKIDKVMVRKEKHLPLPAVAVGDGGLQCPRHGRDDGPLLGPQDHFSLQEGIKTVR